MPSYRNKMAKFCYFGKMGLGTTVLSKSKINKLPVGQKERDGSLKTTHLNRRISMLLSHQTFILLALHYKCLNTERKQWVGSDLLAILWYENSG